MGRWMRSAAVVGACFGVGWLVAPEVSTAHACDCIGSDTWVLERQSVEGDGDVEAEVAKWPVEMGFWAQDGSGGLFEFVEEDRLDLSVEAIP